MEPISTFVAAKLVKIEYHRLTEWLRGFFFPSLSRANGRGTRTKFSVADVYRLQVMRLLVEFGISRELTADICKDLQMVAASDETYFKHGVIDIGRAELNGGIVYNISLDKQRSSADNLAIRRPDIYLAAIRIDLAEVKSLIDGRMKLID